MPCHHARNAVTGEKMISLSVRERVCQRVCECESVGTQQHKKNKIKITSFKMIFASETLAKGCEGLELLRCETGPGHDEDFGCCFFKYIGYKDGYKGSDLISQQKRKKIKAE